MEVSVGLPLPGGSPEGPSVVATIGNFDGVHRGHLAIIQAARAAAAPLAGHTVVVTFEPHPRAVVGGGPAPALLSPLDAKRDLLEGAGVDRLRVVEFTPATMRLEPELFLARLRAAHRLAALVVGPGFAFGYRRRGTVAMLEADGRVHGYRVVVVDPALAGGERISSSRVRQVVAAGDLETAADLLGRPLRLAGWVVPGRALGRRLGFPTANLRLLPGQALPRRGVYVMRLRDAGGRWHEAAGNVGVRPHFGAGAPQVEAHCLDDPGNLYGQRVAVDCLAWLRDEAVFASDAELIAQMGRDVARARAWFAPGAEAVRG